MASKNDQVKMIERKIDRKIAEAKKYAGQQNAKFDEMVTDHPLAFIGGAFIGGLIVGKLLSDRR
jgi:ElaB/YqjD/DUF883 family membrane-anchored ribosome-binding protein